MFTILQGFDGYFFNKTTEEWEYLTTKDWIFSKVFDSRDPEGRPAMLPSKFIIKNEFFPKSLRDMKKIISLLVENKNVVAIRGQKRVKGSPIRRNKANFNTSVPSTIIAMDVDGIPIPKNISKFDLHKQAEYILTLLKECDSEIFQSDNLGYIAHASASAGLKEGIRLHLILESNISVTQGQLKHLFFELNKVSRLRFGFDIADLAYYSATQPHFFANPVFEDGIKDPFKVNNTSRLVYRLGDNIILPPNLPEFASKKVEFEATHLTLLDKVQGMEVITEDLEEVLEELREATDGVYLRVLPKLFHRALQEGINIAWLERLITPILEVYCKDKERTPAKYIENAKKECLRVFIGEAKRDIPEHVRGVPVLQLPNVSPTESPYIFIPELPPENYLTFVKASLGTGKTTAVVKWLQNNKIEGKFLAITNTRSLVSSNAQKFGAGQYDKSVDMLKYKQGLITRMSTTIHSLHKFRNMTDSIDFVFIDECDAVMNDLLFAPVVKQRRSCIQALMDVLRCAKYVLLSDGDISAETIEAYGTLIDFDKPVASINHQRKMLTDVRAHEFMDENSIWVALQTSLELGDKCILLSDCGPAELNEKAITLRRITGANVKEVHSASTNDPDIRAILDRTNKALIEQQIDCLLCSPSVTSGVDWNYFDTIFTITKTSNQSPNMRFQAIRRDRGAKDIYFYTSKQAAGFMAGSEQYLPEEGWLEKTQQLYASRREIESKNFPNTLRYYLIDQGAKINIFSESWGKLESSEDIYTSERVAAIMASTADYSPPRHNDAYDEKMLMMQYFHIDNINDITEDNVLDYVQKKPHKRAEFFHKLQDLFWESILKCTAESFYPFIEALKKHKREFFLATGQSANPKFARMYLTMAGVSKGDTTTIIDWYRTYCKVEDIVLPTKFMTEEELKAYNEKVSELES